MSRTAKTVRAATNRVRVPAFGELLKEFRGDKSLEQVLINNPEINTSQGTVSGYEQGYNKKPDPVVLWGLANAYGVPVEGLIAVLHANRIDAQLSIDAARHVLREHSHGPRPEVAAKALDRAIGRIISAATDLETIRQGLRPDDGSTPRSRR